MKKTLILLLLCFQFTYAQGVNNNGATMHLKDGITVTVRGNYDNGADAVVNLDTLTLLSIEGSITENGGTYTGEGEVYLNGETYLAVEDALLIPKQFTLHPNHPNPFNPITSLRYDLPEQAQVTLTIYDLMGREITQLVNTTQDAGFRSVQWNATDMHGKPVSAGVYLYQIRAGEFMQTKKMLLLK